MNCVGTPVASAVVKADERPTQVQGAPLRAKRHSRGPKALGVVTNNDQGLVVDYTIAFRPLPAIQIFRDVIYPLIKDILGPEYWEYSENATQRRLPRSTGGRNRSVQALLFTRREI